MNSLLNFRDWKGRTPLHYAVMFDNKQALEAMLYLKANPHVPDAGGYRPIDYADALSPLAQLLQNFQQRTKLPEMHPFEEPKTEEELEAEKEAANKKIEAEKKNILTNVTKEIKKSVEKE